MEATCPLTDGWRKEIWYIYNGILLSHKNEILPFATTWTDLESTMLSEISLRETNIVYYHLCVESKKLMNITKKEYRCRGLKKLVITSGTGKWRRAGQITKLRRTNYYL